RRLRGPCSWSGPGPSPWELRRRAEVVEYAIHAAGPAGHAHPATVEDQTEAERSPFRRWEQRRQLVLGLDGVGLGREPQAPAEPPDVGVHWEPGQAQADAADDVGGLAPHSRQGREVLDR